MKEANMKEKDLVLLIMQKDLFCSCETNEMTTDYLYTVDNSGKNNFIGEGEYI